MAIDDKEFERFLEEVLSIFKENALATYREEKDFLEDITRLHQDFHLFTEAFPELKWARRACGIFAISGFLAMSGLLEMAYFGLRYFIEQINSHTKPRKRDNFLEQVYFVLHQGLSKIVHGEVKPSGIADYRDVSVVAIWLGLSLIRQWNPKLFQEATIQSRMFEYDEEEGKWLLEETMKVLQKWGVQTV